MGLFPKSTLIEEKLFGLTKALVVHHGWTAFGQRNT
jgi:hypothetical protein